MTEFESLYDYFLPKVVGGGSNYDFQPFDIFSVSGGNDKNHNWEMPINFIFEDADNINEIVHSMVGGHTNYISDDITIDDMVEQIADTDNITYDYLVIPISNLSGAQLKEKLSKLKI